MQAPRPRLLIITDSAYALALDTLRKLVKQYGLKSPLVRDWTEAQDGVFGYNSDKKIKVPPALSGDKPMKLQKLRLYQIAAAHFYQRDFKIAAAQFQSLAAQKSFELAGISEYLGERALAAYSLGAGAEVDAMGTIKRLEKKALATSDYQRKLDYLALAGLLFGSALEPIDNVKRVLQAVSHLPSDKIADGDGDDAFGRNLADLTYWLSLSESPIPQDLKDANDMTEWLGTVYDAYDCFYDPKYISAEEKTKYQSAHSKSREKALDIWSKKRTLPWLVAVMLTNGLRGPQMEAARAQASAIPSTSNAYLTARFYLIDALIDDKKIDAARTQLAGVLNTSAYMQAPTTTQNLFKTQSMVCARNIQNYLASATLRVSAASSNNLLVPDKWPKPAQMQNYKAPLLEAIDSECADNIDRNLPYSRWLLWSKNKSVAPNLHGRIVCATWIRAIMLGKAGDIQALTAEMTRCYPTCAAKLKAFGQAAGEGEGDKRNYLFAQICLDNFGFSPYVNGGLPRMGSGYNTFNWYQHNYWQPLQAVPVDKKDQDQDVDSNLNWVADRANADLVPKLEDYYRQKKIDALLSAGEKKAARSELKIMSGFIPARMLSGAVVAYAKSHDEDRDLAEANRDFSLAYYLYKSVKVPYWSGQTDEASKYSKAAFLLLHKNYPNSKWAKRIAFWY